MSGKKTYGMELPSTLWEKIRKKANLPKESFKEVSKDGNTKVVFKDLATAAKAFETIKEINDPIKRLDVTIEE